MGPETKVRGGAERGIRTRRVDRPAAAVVLVSVLLFGSSGVSARTAELALDGGTVKYTVYAPQWIWQGQNINIVSVFENELETTATIQMHLQLPTFTSDRFEYDGLSSQTVAIGPGASGRLAFANIKALTAKKLPDGRLVRFRPEHHVFTLRIAGESDGKKAVGSVDYPIRTVRGAAVPDGPWATWLPVLLILVWCVLIFLILPRMAEPGAWRRPSDPVDERS